MCKLVNTHHRYIWRRPFSTKKVIHIVLSIPKASNPGMIRGPSKKIWREHAVPFITRVPTPLSEPNFPRYVSLTAHVKKKNIVTMNKYNIPFSTVNNQLLPSSICVNLCINKFMKLLGTLQYGTIYYHGKYWIHLIKNKCIITYTSMTIIFIFNFL
jgi:hypothetical protein